MTDACIHPGKTAFTKKDAQTFVNAHPERQLRCYACPCGAWHLTHKEHTRTTFTPAMPLKHEGEFKKYMQ